MVRAFCRLESSIGTVLGTTSVTVRYSAAPGDEDRLHGWLSNDLTPHLTRRTGVTSSFVLRSDRAPEMTAEQRIRGRDAGVDRVLLVSGYAPEAIMSLAQHELSASSLVAHGASPGSAASVYRLACLSSAAT
jgi:hypothetical protein